MTTTTAATTAAPGQSVGPALRERHFLLSAWPWRALLHTASSAGVLLAVAAPLLLAATPVLAVLDSPGTTGLLPAVVLTGLLAVGVVVLLAPYVARVDVWRLPLVDRRRPPAVSEPPGLVVRWRYRLTSPTAWRRSGYCAASVGFGLLGVTAVLSLGMLAVVLIAAPVLLSADEGPIAMGVGQIDTLGEAWGAVVPGLLAAAALPYLCGLVATGHVGLLRLLLADDEAQLESELRTLALSRAQLVHDFDDERRRIERDLHDGAQQRVLSLTMQLGLARLELDTQLGPGHEATRLVHDAHEQAKHLMTELRTFVHGIHPQVLSDVGLGAAVDQISASMTLPVALRDDVGARPARHVESTLFFCITEALNNALRHSGASGIAIELRRDGDDIVADVRDDGHGGADPGRGTGLDGMANRASVIGGTVAISSPAGGPTLVRIVVPDEPAPA